MDTIMENACDMLGIGKKSSDVLGDSKIVLVHYVCVDGGRDRQTELICKYKSYIENILGYDDIINVYIPTFGETRIERLIN